MVLARGAVEGLIVFAELLGKKDAQGNPAQIEAMKKSLCHWIYCTLVFVSGHFVRIDKTQPLYDTRQLTSEVVGFPTPNQLADLTLTEVEDLVEVIAPVLTLIYGTLKY